MKRIALALFLVSGAAAADKPGNYHEYQSDPDLFMLLYTGNVVKRFKPKTAIIEQRPISLKETAPGDHQAGGSIRKLSGHK